MNNVGQERISEGFRLAQSERAIPGGAGAKGSATRPPFRQRRKQGHSTFLIDLGGGVCGGLTEWYRRELGPAGFEAVHAGFQGGDVRFQGVDALVELGK
jgi:hypothetical protein